MPKEGTGVQRGKRVPEPKAVVSPQTAPKAGGKRKTADSGQGDAARGMPRMRRELSPQPVEPKQRVSAKPGSLLAKSKKPPQQQDVKEKQPDKSHAEDSPQQGAKPRCQYDFSSFEALPSELKRGLAHFVGSTKGVFGRVIDPSDTAKIARAHAMAAKLYMEKGPRALDDMWVWEMAMTGSRRTLPLARPAETYGRLACSQVWQPERILMQAIEERHRLAGVQITARQQPSQSESQKAQRFIQALYMEKIRRMPGYRPVHQDVTSGLARVMATGPAAIKATKYFDAFERVRRWAVAEGVEALPMLPFIFMRYLHTLYLGVLSQQEGVEAEHIDMAFAAVESFHEVAGHPSPTVDYGVQEMRKGIYRNLGFRGRGLCP
jgi:hypothetical protein